LGLDGGWFLEAQSLDAPEDILAEG